MTFWSTANEAAVVSASTARRHGSSLDSWFVVCCRLSNTKRPATDGLHLFLVKLVSSHTRSAGVVAIEREARA
jgi:hypothetical protein